MTVGTVVKFHGGLVGTVTKVASKGKKLLVDTGTRDYWVTAKNATVVTA